MAGRDTDGCGGCESPHDTDLGSLSGSSCDNHTDSTGPVTDNASPITGNAGHVIDSDDHIALNRVSDVSCGDDTIRDHSRC
jgi:hypothetical protein